MSAGQAWNAQHSGLSAQQLKHALDVYEQKLKAKELELSALKTFNELAPAMIARTAAQLDMPDDEPDRLRVAADRFFTARLNQALHEHEELSLTVKALKHQMSGIVIVLPR